MNDHKTPRKNLTASLKHEHEYVQAGYQRIMGIDEAGRGPWAGPVVAGCVILPLERRDLSKVLQGVRDSKQMTHLQRTKTAETIKATASAWGTGSASAEEINALGLTKAVKLAMQRAYDMALTDKDFSRPDCIFLDYMTWAEMGQIPQLSIVAGDNYSLSIAAASVLAKTWRDAYMLALDEQYPQYGFAKHKGYGTDHHKQAIIEYGVCPEHRLNYKPIKAILEQA
jgi:ribonuclease HII